jgi:hypothetical protein
MGQYSNTYHESLGTLSDETRDMHQALESLQEELKTPDWYWQRMDTTGGELRHLLDNLHEEIEHACCWYNCAATIQTSVAILQLEDWRYMLGKTG